MSTNDDAVFEPSKDEEGLLLEYDVILCGTGLVQSILSSALARAGKSILHVDARDFYGETDGVLTLPFIQNGHLWSKETDQEEIREMNSSILLKVPSLTLHSTSQLDRVPVLVGTEVETPYGRGHVISYSSKEFNKISISLDKWVLANGKSPHLHIRLPDTAMDDVSAYLVKQSIQPTVLKQAQGILESQSRSFAMDLTPNLIFASGVATHAFLTSGVAEYLEFKPLEGLLWFQDGQLSRVPCSKGDVFSSKLLKPLEKRRLMKFLQVVMDYAVNQQFTQIPLEGVEPSSLSSSSSSSLVNEATVQSLNERTLNQGRSLSRPQNKAVSTTDVQNLMKEIENGNCTLQSYLDDNHKLSHHLINLVRYALALENNVNLISLEQGMENLCKHLQGLGKYGTTAFLTPMYGSGEFSQSFCRSAAVHGGTFLLRRQPREILLGDDGNVSGIVLMDNNSKTSKVIKCKHVVTSRASLPVTSKQFILRRISVVLGRVVNDATEQRHVILIPPDSKDVSNFNVIDGLALDWYSRVAAPETTVLHLSTTVFNLDDVSVLDRAAKLIVPSESTEIYHVTFSHVSPTTTFQSTLGLHICPISAQRLVADTAFEDAKVIFESICQNVTFLALSKEMNAAVQDRDMGRDDDDDDDERTLLKSAVGMIKTKDNINNILDKDEAQALS